jgi:hypothetical protein
MSKHSSNGKLRSFCPVGVGPGVPSVLRHAKDIFEKISCLGTRRDIFEMESAPRVTLLHLNTIIIIIIMDHQFPPLTRQLTGFPYYYYFD